ncbi:MAG: adenylosuccinate lyase [Chitinophagales bacterium]
MLNAISPIDGRYSDKTEPLRSYFSEYGLIKYRVFVEIEYFIKLSKIPLPQLANFSEEKVNQIRKISENFSYADAECIKAIEKTTNHDVKAVEYFLKEQFQRLGLEHFSEFIHFGLTSQDINNTAIPLSVKAALEAVYYPSIENVIAAISSLASQWQTIPMLARTHGQPASPTTLGKELMVFATRLDLQLKELKRLPHAAKFGGATGNFNAHFVAYPEVNWNQFAEDFLSELSLNRSYPTTQIEHYDFLAAQCDAMKRIHTIMIDLCRDIWTYISFDYFKQKLKDGEIGSSAMPHKVNPIDFENAEGNLALANALLEFFASKLPISRLQRDLTDSTVLRNLGGPFAHALISTNSIEKGLSKLILNEQKIKDDLAANWIIVAEAIQTVLRRESYPKPYEKLKELTRGQVITEKTIRDFVNSLDVKEELKEELRRISPFNYIGK